MLGLGNTQFSNSLVLDNTTILKACDNALKAIENELPEEAHTIEVYCYVLHETEERLKSKVIRFK